MSAQQPDRVTIFDTTLRDGEQSPGATMTLPEKLELAAALRDLGVDVIEAGFPAASPGDFEQVQTIARQLEGPVVCGLARCRKDDIEAAGRALADAPRKRMHVFLATSAIHREFKLKMAKDEIVRRAVEGVEQALAFCDDVEFSPEDAARTELDFLAEVVERVIAAGATTVNIPDTVGYAVPQHFAAVIRHLKQTVSGIDKAVLSVHCHDDLGLAVANSLAAIGEGARQVECTINGIGERAGNCSLEEVVMALRTRSDHFGVDTNIRTERLYPTSRLVANITGIHVQRNKAIVGQNAFAHEAGIHQHGMLQNQSTYEIMRPQDVGWNATQLVLGKHSGRHALRQRIEELGYRLDDAQFERVFAGFKELADRKKDIYDGDLEALVGSGIRGERPAVWTIKAVNTSGGTGTMPAAAVALVGADGEEVCETSTGDGPIDAVFKAIERATGVSVTLLEYHVRSVTLGKDSQGEAQVTVQYGAGEHEGDGARTYRGRATSTDTIEASARAFVDVVNRVLVDQEREARS